MRLCGQQAVWNYEEENGILTIQGVGAMEDYTDPEQVPWNTFIQKIKTVVIRPQCAYAAAAHPEFRRSVECRSPLHKSGLRL